IAPGGAVAAVVPPPAAQASEPAAPELAVIRARPDAFSVLIVDDNPINRQVLEMILDSAGVDHEAAANGLEAVERVSTGAFDAVLMDIQMPVMDGLEATRRIREWEGRQGGAHRPIFIVSANCMPEHVAAGRAAGADGHIAKPVSAAKVLTALTGQAA
ncbi:MAG: response regulator, partial [Caulobacteraceae bacterium]